MKNHNEIEIILFEGCLNDDYALVNKLTGKTTLVYYTFANSWSNHEHKKRFWSLEDACDWYRKQFPDRVILQGACWLTEDGETDDPDLKHLSKIVCDDYSTALDKMTEVEKTDSISEWENFTIYCVLD